MNGSDSVRISPKRTLRHILEEACGQQKKLAFHGPDNLRPDSRYTIIEIASDHVVIQLIGEEQLAIPFAAIQSLRVSSTQIAIRYG